MLWLQPKQHSYDDVFIYKNLCRDKGTERSLNLVKNGTVKRECSPQAI